MSGSVRKDSVLAAVASLPALLYGLFILAPFLWVVMSAFKRQIDILMARVWFQPTLDNFRKLLDDPDANFLRNLSNSLIASLAATAIVLVIALLAAYCLLQLRLPRWLGPALLGVTMLFHMVPPITFVGSWYMMFRAIGLFDTLPGLVLGYVATNIPLGLWLAVNYARELPRELMEASDLDCLGPWQQFRRVFVPLMRNGLVATGLLVFIFVWSDFIVALNLTARGAQTVPVAISLFAQNEQIRYAEMAASSLLAMLPALLLLVVGQRYIVQGLLSGSAK